MSTMLSYQHTPLSSPLIRATLPEMLKRQVNKSPDKEAYVFRLQGQPRQAVTFSQLDRQSDQMAIALRKLNLQTGDYAVITGITSYEWILTDVACMKAGLPTVRMSTGMAYYQGLVDIMNKFRAPILFYHPGIDNQLKAFLQKTFEATFAQGGRDIKDETMPYLKHWVTMTLKPEDGIFTLDTLLKLTEGDDVQDLLPNVDPDDVATVYLTSGSTGLPKSVALSHFILVNEVLHVVNEFVDKYDTRYFSDRSFAWSASYPHYTLVTGNTSVYLHPDNVGSSKQVDFYLQVIKEERINNGIFLQYILVDLIDRLKETGQKIYIPRGITTGEVIHSDLIEKARGFIGNLQTLYGSTEIFDVTYWYKDTVPSDIPGYVGYPAPGVECKIVNGEGKVVPRSEIGTLCVRGPCVEFRGYLFGEKTGMTVSATGWVNTGDMAIMVPDGRIKIAGRKQHVISRSTRKFMPSMIEEFLLNCSDVYKVAVVGVPDRRLGEEICACIMPQNGVQDTVKIKAWCNDVYVTDEGLGITPGYFLLANSFPTVNGKIDRIKLKKWAIEQIGLESSG